MARFRSPRLRPRPARAAPHMRLFGLIILAAALLWGVLALATGSADLGIGGSSGSGPAEAGVGRTCLPSPIEHSAALPGARVDASPAPGTVTANPATQISFLRAPASQIRSVTAVGSESGSHSGGL